MDSLRSSVQVGSRRRAREETREVFEGTRREKPKLQGGIYMARARELKPLNTQPETKAV